MKVVGEGIRFSSRDLTGYVACDHLTALEFQVARGNLSRPKPKDPSLEALWERGFRHEQEFIDHLAGEGLAIVTVDGVDVDDAAIEATREAMPMPWAPARGSRQSFERVREQARIQVESRNAGSLLFETLPIVVGFGLAALPEPSAADIYLDFEGDSFVGEHGQEYLLG